MALARANTSPWHGAYHRFTTSNRYKPQCMSSRRFLSTRDQSSLVARQGCGCSASLHVGWPSENFQRAKEAHATQEVYASPIKTDILGLGQAMVDFGAHVPSELLSTSGWDVEKGSRKLISVTERTNILNSIGDSYHIAAGGSLSNTLIDLARLVEANNHHRSSDGQHHTVAMTGLIGNDALGSFYRAQMDSAGVSVCCTDNGNSNKMEHVNTGTVIVLTTEDAQRTMLSYLGTQMEVPVSPQLEDAIRNTSILVIEGYMWELPNAKKTILHAISIAKENGVRVAMTAGDSGVVLRHADAMWESIHAGVDILFTNAEEAAALSRSRPVTEYENINKSSRITGPATSKAEAAALCLGPHCPMVCVTDGSAGSVIASLGQIWVIPPHWTQSPPIDTCGAGDAWAAGILYGLLYHQGGDIISIGNIAARSASAVIATHGPTLCTDAAAHVVPGNISEPLYHSYQENETDFQIREMWSRPSPY